MLPARAGCAHGGRGGWRVMHPNCREGDAAQQPHRGKAAEAGQRACCRCVRGDRCCPLLLRPLRGMPPQRQGEPPRIRWRRAGSRAGVGGGMCGWDASRGRAP